MRSAVPYVLTVCGLLSGMCGFVALQSNDFEAVFYWVVAAAAFDLLDGAAARALGVASEAGKLLDALSDVVCFGALPALWLHKFILAEAPTATLEAYAALLFAAAAALRLMTFLQQADTHSFKGLPVPGAAVFMLSLCFLPKTVLHLTSSPGLWLLLIGWGLCAMMLSSLPLIAMKFVHLRWKGNEARYLLLGLAIGLALWLQQLLFLVLIPAYLLLSLLVYMLKRPA